jgi:8-oxo-dGTP diphosphatase
MKNREHRISSGAVVIHADKILLVRYNDRNGRTYLVAPGGGVKNEEALSKSIIREVKEETGLEVRPIKLLFVEDLFSQRYRMVKVWFLSELTGGRLERTRGAIDEKITAVKWYRLDELKDEVVFPTPLKETDWKAFFRDDWTTKYLELRYADF